MKKILFISIILFSAFSCSQPENVEEKYTYDIISLLYNDLTFVSDVPMFPPPPSRLNNEDVISDFQYSRQDSLKIIKYYKERVAKKQIIAVVHNMEASVARNVRLNPDCTKEYGNLLEDFFKMKKFHKKIDISKIVNNRKDSIMYFKKELLPKFGKDFNVFDIILSFSQIKFNKKLDKAILIVSRSTSRLAGFNSIYFLERKNRVWTIKCIKGLTIS